MQVSFFKTDFISFEAQLYDDFTVPHVKKIMGQHFCDAFGVRVN